MDECHFPSDQRREITRVEVVRIRTQQHAGEEIAPLIEDPWKTLSCDPTADGCDVLFSDPDFPRDGRGTSYYVRAIEAASEVVDANPLRCDADPGENAEGRCIKIDPCFNRPDRDDCTAPSEQRAWSSPIFVDHQG
jgi:hypothetical protein